MNPRNLPFATALAAASAVAFVLSLTLTARTAFAYIPNSKTIFARLAKNDGRGTYQIEQEVQFRTEGEPVVLRERWTVAGGDSMRLAMSSVKGSTEGWRLDVVYSGGKRFFYDANGNPKSVSQSTEFIEPYLHFRSAKGIQDALVRQKVLPTNLGALKKPAKSVNGQEYKVETFVRLARSGGTVTYAMGEPTPPNSARLNPGFWVDQDAFLFRRLRFPSQAEVEADRHLFAAGGLRIPRDRTVSWDGNIATIRVLSVKAVTDAAAVKKLLSPQSFSSAKGTTPKLPETASIKEFYQRFR